MARDDFRRLLARHRRRMDAERREFAERATEIVRRAASARETFDGFAYTLAMRDIDALLSEFYGAFPHDRRARFWWLILDECRAARVLAFGRGVQEVRRHLRGERDMLRRIEEVAGGD